MGPSGAGKTTLCLSLSGLISHRMGGYIKGKVNVLGMDVMEATIRDLSSKVGIMFQDPETQFVSMNVRSEIVFGMENFGVPREEMIRRLEWASELVGIKGILCLPAPSFFTFLTSLPSFSLTRAPSSA